MFLCEYLALQTVNQLKCPSTIWQKYLGQLFWDIAQPIQITMPFYRRLWSRKMYVYKSTLATEFRRFAHFLQSLQRSILQFLLLLFCFQVMENLLKTPADYWKPFIDSSSSKTAFSKETIFGRKKIFVVQNFSGVK